MARSVLLLEIGAYDLVGASALTLYLSDGPYATEPSDTPASQTFAPLLENGVDIRRRLQGVGGGAVRPSVGEVRVLNADGRFDAWLGYAFDGRPVTAKLGPADGAYATDFTTVFTGTIDRLDVQRESLVLRLRDGIEAYRTPLLTARFAGDNVPPDGVEGEAELEGAVKPRVYGQVRNIPLTCVNAQKLIYQVSGNQVAGVDGVFDSGIALAGGDVSATIAVGSAGLNSGPANRGGIAYIASIGRYVTGSRGIPLGAPEAIYTCDNEDLLSWTPRSSVFDIGASQPYVSSVRYFEAAGLVVAVGSDNTGAGACATSSDNGATWNTRTLVGLLPAAQDAHCTAYGAGTLVVGGTNGLIDYSTNGGVTFSAASSPLTQSIQDIVFEDGLFVAVGNAGQIATSIDGQTWTARTSGTTTNLTCVHYVDDRWVVLGNSGRVLTSYDSSVWTVRSDGVGTGKDSFVDYAGYLLAVGGTAPPTISLDRGATWEVFSSSLGFNARDIVYDGSRIVLFGETTGTVLSVVSTVDGVQLYGSDADLQDDALAPAPGTFGVRMSASGTYIRLGSPPFGQLTADVTQGATTADRTAAALIEQVLTDAGYTSADWVAADFTALDAADNAVQGLYVNDDRPVADVLDALARSVGAWWTQDALGRFRVRQLADPSGATPDFSIVEAQVLGLERLSVSDPLLGIPSYRTTLRYSRNHTVQRDGLAGAVSASRRADLGREWREVVDTDTAVQTAHLLARDASYDTTYADAAGAQAEATRRQALYGTKRNAFAVTVPLDDFAAVELGDIVDLTHPRFGLSGGVTALCVGVEPDTKARTTTLTLWL